MSSNAKQSFILLKTNKKRTRKWCLKQKQKSSFEVKQTKVSRLKTDAWKQENDLSNKKLPSKVKQSLKLLKFDNDILNQKSSSEVK